jgi:hypothetical protein
LEKEKPMSVTVDLTTIPSPSSTVAPSALTWQPDETGRLRAVFTPRPVCPACESPCGALIDGVCLGCLVEWDEQIAAAEARYDADAETCCTCGVD